MFKFFKRKDSTAYDKPSYFIDRLSGGLMGACLGVSLWILLAPSDDALVCLLFPDRSCNKPKPEIVLLESVLLQLEQLDARLARLECELGAQSDPSTLP